MIEIKELVIKAVVDNSLHTDTVTQSEVGQEQLVNLCVEQVLAILERQRQR